MKPKRILSIRASLAWLVMACLLPAIVITVVLLYYDYQRARVELIRDSLSTARALMHAVDREFASAEMSLRALATSPSLDKQDFSAFHAQARDMLRRHSLNNIALIDAGGQQRMNTARTYGEPLPKATSMGQLERILKSGQSDVSDLFIGPILKTPLITVGVPVHSGNTVAHSLVGVILPAHLQEILVDQGFPPDRIAVIADRAGTVVARTHDIGRFIGQTVTPVLAQRLKESDEGSFETVSLEGIPVLTVFVRSATSRWGVAIGVPVETLTADLRHSLWLLIGFATLLMAGSLGLAWILGGRIARAIRALRSPALALGYGNAVAVPELAISEADEVGKAITKASTMLVDTNEALTGSEARMRGILESAMDAIITVNDSQIIMLFNSAASVMFACPVEQAIGLSITRFIPERIHAGHHACVQQYNGRGNASGTFDAAGIAVGLRYNGEEFPVEVSYSNVVESGAPLHTLIIRDVTARVRAYAALERSNLDLQQFAYVASHDLKTPLRSIAGFIQLLERNHGAKLDEKGLALIQRTGSAVRRLEQLTEDLLSYARIDAEVKQFVPVDLAEVVRDVVHLLHAPIQTANAVLTVGEMPVVLGDRTQLAQLLMNLLGNSLKYCRDRAPEVEISAVLEEREWVFSVKDNGIGIDAKHHEKVFEVFKRLHTQNDYPGTGIGLAICRRVVEGHGGKIWVTSESGVGSTFSFTLPVFSPEASDEA
ncbi:sensor histidine kinase [Polaromonas eurypsychrophila]|uniref:histidine kinase n=1 Tax=Polaromonas eurypsychrophila TaxID=1614635 RepID=A0A916SLV4_9BURK|nr:ATP-binding protein [Polaromonas eurypsychrophila]GGB06442.1 hypothetical protein GCM10011496_29160 [Polaromonas eurypsychrophila]